MAAELLTSEVSEGVELPVLEKDVKPVTVVLGAMASRDWRPQHHDYKFATENNGLDDIFMNTPNQAAWKMRFATSSTTWQSGSAQWKIRSTHLSTGFWATATASPLQQRWTRSAWPTHHQAPTTLPIRHPRCHFPSWVWGHLRAGWKPSRTCLAG